MAWDIVSVSAFVLQVTVHIVNEVIDKVADNDVNVDKSADVLAKSFEKKVARGIP